MQPLLEEGESKNSDVGLNWGRFPTGGGGGEQPKEKEEFRW